jgi:low affinity Fe/Cu permease
MYRTSRFHLLARWAAMFAGRPATFLGALLVILVWAATGPWFKFSDTWQLVINTSTTIITFLMVFLIQNTQNRDTEAIQLKLDELIRCTQGAHNALLDLEDLTEQELEKVRADYSRLAAEARTNLGRGLADTGTPDVRPGSPGPAGVP